MLHIYNTTINFTDEFRNVSVMLMCQWWCGRGWLDVVGVV